MTAALHRHLPEPYNQAVFAMALDRVINPKPHSKCALALTEQKLQSVQRNVEVER